MMSTRSTMALVAVCLAFLQASPAQADEAYQRLVDSQADSVVSIKYVLSVRFSSRGQSQDSERSGTAIGIVVDPVGLIIVPSRDLSPSMRFPGLEMSSTPTSLRVIFPGDPKEYDAVLAATDSRIGLSFVRIKDLEGKQIKTVDLSRSAEPKLGMRAYGVSRMDQGFDYAPFCAEVMLAGRVTKPRQMWVLRGWFSQLAHPLFTEDGRVLGFVVTQEGVGDGGRRPFLLPLKVVQATMKRAAREAERVLEEALEREEEEAAEAAEEPDAGEEEPEESESTNDGGEKPAEEPK